MIMPTLKIPKLRWVIAAIAYFARGLPRLAADRAISDPHFLAAAKIARDAFAAHADWLTDQGQPEHWCARSSYPSGEPGVETAKVAALLNRRQQFTRTRRMRCRSRAMTRPSGTTCTMCTD